MASPVSLGGRAFYVRSRRLTLFKTKCSLCLLHLPAKSRSVSCSFRLCEIITRLVSKMNIRLITEIYTATVGCPWYTVRVRKFVNGVECKIPLRFAWWVGIKDDDAQAIMGGECHRLSRSRAWGQLTKFMRMDLCSGTDNRGLVCSVSGGSNRGGLAKPTQTNYCESI